LKDADKPEYVKADEFRIMLTAAIQIILSCDMFVKDHKVKIIRANSVSWLSCQFKHSFVVSNFGKIFQHVDNVLVTHNRLSHITDTVSL
jgi:hypothetical protein